MAGQIIERGPRTWLVRIFLGRTPTGKRKYLNRTIRGSKKDAQRFLTEKLHERDRGKLVVPSKTTVSDYLLRWVDEGKPGIQERTRASYRWILLQYVLPRIGDRRLDQVGPLEVQELYNALNQRGLSARTVRYTHSIVRSAFAQAVRWGLLAGNPADLAELPARDAKEMRALSPAEAAVFLQAVRGDRWGALWELLLVTGLRPGEALGLKWSDVEWTTRRLRIQRTLVRGDDHEWRLAEPKTDRSRRSVVVPDLGMDALRRHRAKQAEERLSAGAAYRADLDLVFANALGAPLDYRTTVRRHFKPLVEAAGLGNLRPYDLRHTCATLLLANGEHPKVVAERLGHASTVMTMDVYSHVLPNMQEAAADRLDALLASGRARTP